MCVFHKWGPWETYEQKFSRILYSKVTPLEVKEYETSRTMQRRTCKKCNMLEIREVEEKPKEF